jgi:hypothetical protein
MTKINIDRRTYKFAAKILFSLCTFFILLELLLRFGYQNFPKIKYFLYSSRYDTVFEKIVDIDAVKKYAPCPMIPGSRINKFTINSNGFYAKDYKKEKDPGVVRIGFVGDSFLVGVVPYENNFVTLVERNLLSQSDEVSDKKYEVINWGIPCIGPRFEEKIFEIEALKVRPDYLVWNFFVGNDFTDELFPDEKLPLANIIVKNTYALRLLRNTQRYLKSSFQTRESILNSEYDPSKPTFSESQYLMMLSEKLRLFSDSSFPNFQWLKIKEIFYRLSKKCADYKIKCLVVIIPDESQVDRELLKQTADKANTDLSKLNIDYPQKLLTEFFSENDIEYIDLLPIFKDHKIGLYQPRDTHWNIEGNKLAAQMILDFFRNKWGIGLSNEL